MKGTAMKNVYDVLCGKFGGKLPTIERLTPRLRFIDFIFQESLINCYPKRLKCLIYLVPYILNLQYFQGALHW
jgi:hypothetical protein